MWTDSNCITIYVGAVNVICARRHYSSSGEFAIIAGQQASSGPSDGIGTNAMFGNVRGIIGDANVCNLYFTEYSNRIIRKLVTSTYAVTRIAGNGVSVSGTDGDGGLAFSASFRGPCPWSLAIDSAGSIIVTDNTASNIR